MNQKLQRARVQLLIHQPFFATLLLHMDCLPLLADGETMGTDGFKLVYSESFVESLDPLELQGVLCHEVLHVANLHTLRKGLRDHFRFNVAADYAINPILLQAGFKLPKGGLVDEKYYGMSAEQIYDLLPPELDDIQMQGGKMGIVTESPNPSQETQEKQEKRIREMVVQAAQIAQAAGKLPQNLRNFVDDLLQPEVAWTDTLAQFMTSHDTSDYCWTRPNPRYIYSGFILPSLYAPALSRIWFFIDTSGSVYGDRPTLAAFTSELRYILNQFNKDIPILYIDTHVHGPDLLEAGDDKGLELQGGGGTDFAPGFHWLEQNGEETVAVIYFTDGYCDSYPPEPPYPVLWCIWGGNTHFNPPFGQVIHVKA